MVLSMQGLAAGCPFVHSVTVGENPVVTKATAWRALIVGSAPTTGSVH
jgi:hypothetical protein